MTEVVRNASGDESVMIVNKKGETPLDLACERGFKDIIRLLDPNGSAESKEIEREVSHISVVAEDDE